MEKNVETVTIRGMMRTVERSAALAILFVAWAAMAGPKDEGGGVLARVQSFYEVSKDYSASFKQVVTTKSPKRTFTRRGRVYFKRPGMMRWDYKVPDEVYYVSDGEVLWSYSVEEGVAYRLRIRDSSLFHSLKFLTGGGRLAEDFKTRIGDPAGNGLVPVTLLPKGSNKSFRSVILYVDPATGETRETVVEDPLGNISHLWFSDPSYVPLPAERFSFTPPSGVRVREVGGK